VSAKPNLLQNDIALLASDDGNVDRHHDTACLLRSGDLYRFCASRTQSGSHRKGARLHEMLCLTDTPAVFLCAVMLLVSTTASHAGPCTTQIAQVQAQVAARADAIAASGPRAPESTAARLHRQPTPGSIARAVPSVDERSNIEKALAALERAREADRSANAGNCEQALAEARRAIGR
jgi:hypothetical protein